MSSELKQRITDAVCHIVEMSCAEESTRNGPGDWSDIISKYSDDLYALCAARPSANHNDDGVGDAVAKFRKWCVARHAMYEKLYDTPGRFITNTYGTVIDQLDAHLAATPTDDRGAVPGGGAG